MYEDEHRNIEQKNKDYSKRTWTIIIIVDVLVLIVALIVFALMWS